MTRGFFGAVASVARKEFIHIYRDRRVLILLLILPPIFTLVFGHAFEVGEMADVPAIVVNADAGAPRAQRFVDFTLKNKTFQWRVQPPSDGVSKDLLRQGVRATLVIPAGWSESLANGKPIPLEFFLDASDTNIAPQLLGSLQETLGKFQLAERQEMIDALPDDVFDLAQKIPVTVRKQFVSAMEQWSVDGRMLYNPQERFIDYVIPGIIGLILQLITVTLMACTIARERESGTLYQLMVTSLRRWEIVLGKIVPYFVISICLIVMIALLAGWHFQVAFHQPFVLALICVVFLLCSLGLGPGHLRDLEKSDAGDPVLGLFPSAGLYPFRRVRAARAASGGDSLDLGTLPAHSFLPGFSAGESLPRRTGFLPAEPARALRGNGPHLRQRGLFAPPD